MLNFETNQVIKDRGYFRKGISLLLFFLVMSIAITFFYKNWEVFVSLVDISPGYLVSMSLLIIAFQSLAGMKIKILTSIFDIALKPREWFGLAQVNSLLNYLPIRGGGAANAFYLKGFFNFPFLKYIAVLTASFAITTAVLSFAGCFSTVIVYIFYGVFAGYTLSVYIILLTLTVALFFSIKWIVTKVTNRHLFSFLSGWERIRKSGKKLVVLIAMDFAMISIDTMRIKLSYGRFGFDLNYFKGMAMVPISNLVSVVSMVPGGVVVRELVIGLISEELGMGFKVGVFASALDRALLFFWILLLGALSMVLLHYYRKDV
jgi:uncharacterized membrane protein YbhN (UPF0104 family)